MEDVESLTQSIILNLALHHLALRRTVAEHLKMPLKSHNRNSRKLN